MNKLSPQELAELEVLSQCKKGEDFFTLAVVSLPPELQGMHNLCRDAGYYVLVDLIIDQHGTVFRIFKLTERGIKRRNELAARLAGPKIIGLN